MAQYRRPGTITYVERLILLLSTLGDVADIRGLVVIGEDDVLVMTD